MLQDLNDISDGKVYSCNDMARVACNDCEGCHACCENMGTSIILDPMDMWRLKVATGKGFGTLMADTIELTVVDGLILPHLKMAGKKTQCIFLNEEGRCSIHVYRPGLCRVFPLGRIYEEQGISYFVQRDACQKTNRSKIKVSKWLDMPQLKEYEKFLLEWHALRKSLEGRMAGAMDEAAAKTMNMFVLNLFYVTEYDETGDFYPQFAARMKQAKETGIC